MASLRPAVAAYLEQAARSATDPIGRGVADLRAHWDAFVMQTHRFVRAPEMGCMVTDHVTVEGVSFRLYHPEAPVSGTHLHVHLHGGGWWMGSVETVDPMSRSLAAELRMPVVSVAYPLAPEHPWPAALEAVLAVLEWATEQYDSITLGGESAGANLAAAVALHVRDRGGPSLAGLWLDVPVTDLRLPQDESVTAFGTGFGLETAMLGQIAEWYAGARSLDDPLISPALADLRGLPPTLITVAECDPLRDQGLRFAEHLTAAGVSVDTRVAEGHVHGSSWLTGLDDYTRNWHRDAVAGLAAMHQKELTS